MILFRNLTCGIKNLITWFSIIWNDRWWDWTFILVILRKKLILTEKSFRKYGHHLHVNKDAELMKKCILIINRILENKYHDIAFKKYDNKWGKPELIWHESKEADEYSNLEIKYKNVKNEEDEKERAKDRSRASKHENMLKKQDLHMLFNILKKHIDSWWD
ncbi:MAG: hypothetical protein PVG65_07315 [Candidatus Thorarchaeota archaeon]|jgi:hypothetical protein